MAKKKKPEEAPPGSPAWMATFSDLMNLLLCFFVLLFSMSSVDATKYEAMAASFKNSFSIFKGGQTSIGEGQLISSGVSQLTNLDDYFSDMGSASEEEEVNDGDPMEEYKKALKEATEDVYEEIAADATKKSLDDYISIDMDENYTYVLISINGGVLFDSGKADLKKEVLPVLSRVGDILLEYKDRRIVIEGHTDNVPISNSQFRNNMELSWQRANSVWQYMTETKKIPPEHLESAGRGEYNPIADNNTTKGRAQNRRVEFKIYTDMD